MSRKSEVCWYAPVSDWSDFFIPKLSWKYVLRAWSQSAVWMWLHFMCDRRKYSAHMVPILHYIHHRKKWSGDFLVSVRGAKFRYVLVTRCCDSVIFALHWIRLIEGSKTRPPFKWRKHDQARMPGKSRQLVFPNSVPVNVARKCLLPQYGRWVMNHSLQPTKTCLCVLIYTCVLVRTYIFTGHVYIRIYMHA